jgi:predicted Zn-dependent protease
MVPNRLERLLEFVRDHPDDAFARYGLAMEYARTGRGEAALEEFAALRERHPDYAAGYQQAGQLLIAHERPGEARALLVAGVAAALRSGDRHAAAEMQGLLDELPPVPA